MTSATTQQTSQLWWLRHASTVHHVHPEATGTCDFLGVNIAAYLVVISGGSAGLLIWWDWPQKGLLRVYARNTTKFPIRFFPMVKDDRPDPTLKLPGECKA